MPERVAKIAVSAATYWIDKPYDYRIPEELADRVKPGVRVYVPFARGNRRSEGIVLALSDSSGYDKLKAILSVLDAEPVLGEEQIRLALFMRDRFFCTVYDAVKAMLPAGLWFDSEGKRRVNDKTVEMARLAVAPEDASVMLNVMLPRMTQLLSLLSPPPMLSFDPPKSTPIALNVRLPSSVTPSLRPSSVMC